MIGCKKTSKFVLFYLLPHCECMTLSIKYWVIIVNRSLGVISRIIVVSDWWKNCSLILLFKSCCIKFDFILSDILPLINVSTKCLFFQKVIPNIWGNFINTLIGLCIWGFVLFSLTVLIIHLLRGNKFSLSCLVFLFWVFLILCEGMFWCICVCVFNFFFDLFSAVRNGSMFCVNLKLCEFEEKSFCF